MGDAVLGPVGVADRLIGGGDVGNPTSNQSLEEMALALFGQTDPLRQNLIGRSERFLSGDLDVTQSPMFGALKGGIESQYNRARENIIGATPAGGALTGALTDLEAAKAGDLARGIGGLAQDELSRALGLATGTTGQTFGALGQAGAIQGQIAQANADREAANKQALGAGAGAFAGGK